MAFVVQRLARKMRFEMARWGIFLLAFRLVPTPPRGVPNRSRGSVVGLFATLVERNAV